MGRASTGGFASNGTIFEFTSGGTFQLLAPFNSTLGDTPLGPLVAANDGWIYGTTYSGGSNNLGAIYRFNRFGEIGQVFSFNGTNGANPIGGLTLGSDGNLYGTTEYGGNSGIGSVFRFVPEGGFSNLYSFTDNIGAFPGTLVQAPNGNFYGTTISGGTNVAGTIFQFFTSGFVQSLYSFDVDTGSSPNSPLVAAYAGNLYGTTEQGGGFGQGAIFAIAPNGVLIDLFSFNGMDGARPRSGMVLGADGNFYGTTSQGGANNSGVIYQLTGFPPVIIEAPASLRWVTNGTAKFTTVAEGSAPLSYQWFFDETNSIPGATNASLTIVHEQLTNSGTYTLVVSNAYGTVTNTNRRPWYCRTCRHCCSSSCDRDQSFADNFGHGRESRRNWRCSLSSKQQWLVCRNWNKSLGNRSYLAARRQHHSITGIRCHWRSIGGQDD
jgi:uncharacterized repeat protein (TIGR03803 family)